MRKLNLYEVYSFAKELSAIRSLPREGKVSHFVFPLWDARERLNQLIATGLLLSSSSRAALALKQQIDLVIPADLGQAINIDDSETLGWKASTVSARVTELETVLGNDMPDIASYVVSQKGIYRTADLIEHAENQLSDEARLLMSAQTCQDIRDAGRSLAYELPTACAFHLWRAVESSMGTYYQRLTGNDWTTAKISRNWGSYIKAMQVADAPSKITAFLDHIREEYRNPHTHPDEAVPITEAQRLFPVALSAIEQLLLETDKLSTKASAATPSSVVMALTSVVSSAPIATAPKP